MALLLFVLLVHIALMPAYIFINRIFPHIGSGQHTEILKSICMANNFRMDLNQTWHFSYPFFWNSKVNKCRQDVLHGSQAQLALLLSVFLVHVALMPAYILINGISHIGFGQHSKILKLISVLKMFCMDLKQGWHFCYLFFLCMQHSCLPTF